jgi:hypothetical protein
MPAQPITKRGTDPTPVPGLATKPHGDVCAPVAASCPPVSPAPPLVLVVTRGRRRARNPQPPCGPDQECAYDGWGGRGHNRAHGHPGGGRWRQLPCVVGHPAFQATHGTPLQGPRVSPERLVGAVGARAEGLGLGAGARVCAGAPNTGLPGLPAAADPAAAGSPSGVPDVPVSQGPLDARVAGRRAVQAGEGRDAQAIQRRSRAPHGGWVARDPVRTGLLGLAAGARPLAMAQRLGHQVVPGRAPDGVPRFMTDGRTDAAMALRTPVGPWGQPARQPAHRPVPTPRGRPRPPLLEAPVVTSARRRRVVRVRHRVVGGTWARVNRGLAARGWPSHPAGLARANLTIRPHGAAVGRRVMTRCPGEDGLRQQRAWEQAYATGC